MIVDVPHDAVLFAESKFVRGGIDRSARLGAFLSERSGSRQAEARITPSECDVGSLTEALSGIVRLLVDVGDRDLLAHGMLGKYESLSCRTFPFSRRRSFARNRGRNKKEEMTK